MPDSVIGLQGSLTEHAARRMRHRAISRAAIDLAFRRGERIEQNGATVYFLGRRHLPDGLVPAIASRWAGTAVVMARDGTVVTTFRRRRVPRRLRRRPKPWRLGR